MRFGVLGQRVDDAARRGDRVQRAVGQARRRQPSRATATTSASVNGPVPTSTRCMAPLCAPGAGTASGRPDCLVSQTSDGLAPGRRGRRPRRVRYGEMCAQSSSPSRASLRSLQVQEVPDPEPEARRGPGPGRRGRGQPRRPAAAAGQLPAAARRVAVPRDGVLGHHRRARRQAWPAGGRRRGLRAARRRRVRRAGRRAGRPADARSRRAYRSSTPPRCPRSPARCGRWCSAPGRLQPGESVLVHGGTSGIGTMAIQLAHARGARVFATAGTPRKVGVLPRARRRRGDQLSRRGLRRAGASPRRSGAGVDVMLDNMGASYLPRNVLTLGLGGRLIVLGLQGGRKGELDLGHAAGQAGHRARRQAAGRSLAQKAEIVAETQHAVWPLIESGAVRPIIDRVLTLDDAAEAHRLRRIERAHRQGAAARPEPRPRSHATSGRSASAERVQAAGRPRASRCAA